MDTDEVKFLLRLLAFGGRGGRHRVMGVELPFFLLHEFLFKVRKLAIPCPKFYRIRRYSPAKDDPGRTAQHADGIVSQLSCTNANTRTKSAPLSHSLAEWCSI